MHLWEKEALSLNSGCSEKGLGSPRGGCWDQRAKASFGENGNQDRVTRTKSFGGTRIDWRIRTDRETRTDEGTRTDGGNWTDEDT